jgi:glutamyl-tRNA synthetase
MASNRPRGRWAPTPSGLLHVGSARTALLTWLSMRRAGGTLVWRLEDLDPPRAVPGAAEAAMEELAWLGLDWDEGPDRGGPCGPYAQSERSDCYQRALRRLADAGRLFPCRRSRKDLRELATAPHGRYGDPGPPPYPKAWRPDRLEPGWFEAFARDGDEDGDGYPLKKRRALDAALRFRVAEEEVSFVDRLQGSYRQRVDVEVGDFILERRDGLYAYQLAVVVDDLAMEIDEVVRGVDLIDSTPRQLQLIHALGGTPPEYVHVPLVLDAEGEKLSKRHGALTLRHLREAGIRAEKLVGYLAWSAGLTDQPDPVRPAELVEGFRWRRLRRDDWLLPEDLVAELG